MNAFADPSFCFSLVLSLLGVEFVISSVEFLSMGHLFRPGEDLAWKANDQPHNPRLSRIARVFGSANGTRFTLLAQLLLAIAAPLACWLKWSTLFLFPLVLALALVRLWHRVRFAAAACGADAMSGTILITGSLWCVNPDDPVLGKICLCFLGFQGCLAYVGAAWAKLRSAHWRSGQHLVSVYESCRARLPRLGRCLRRSPALAWVITWLVILLEVFLPVAFLGGPQVMLGFAIAAIVFHFAIAVMMGYHGFFWTFTGIQIPMIYLAIVWSRFAFNGPTS